MEAVITPAPQLFSREDRLLFTSTAEDVSPRVFLERLVREKRSLARADLTRLLREWPGDHTLDGAMLDGADLVGCQGSGLSFIGAKLRGAVLRNAVLRGVSISDADLSGAIIDGSGFSNCIGHRVRMETIPESEGSTSRHILRPELDEFVPYSRCLARTTDFSEADLRWARIISADFSTSELYKADLRHAWIERSNFEGADVRKAKLDLAWVFRCDLSTPSLHLASARGALFRNNIYMQPPGVNEIAEAGFKFPRQLFHYLREEFHQRRQLAPEVRRDLDRMLAIRAFVLILMPTLVSLSWKHIETAPGVSTALAFGAVSVFAARRYVTIALQGIISAIFSRLNAAEGALRAGHPLDALAVFILPGLASERLDRYRERPPTSDQTEG